MPGMGAELFINSLEDAESRAAAANTTGGTGAAMSPMSVPGLQEMPMEDTSTIPVAPAEGTITEDTRRVVKSEVITDPETGAKTVIRTYADGTTDESVIPTMEEDPRLTAMQSIPIVSNLVTAAMLRDKFDFSDYKLSPDDSIIQKRDVTPLIRDVEAMVATGRGVISSRAGSTAELLTGLANLTAVGMAETGKIRNQQYQDYIEAIDRQQQLNLRIAELNANRRQEVDAANLALKKERLSLINAAATEASKVADGLKQDNLSKYELEQMYLMYPYLRTTIKSKEESKEETEG